MLIFLPPSLGFWLVVYQNKIASANSFQSLALIFFVQISLRIFKIKKIIKRPLGDYFKHPLPLQLK